MTATAISQTPRYSNGQERQYLMNGTGQALVVGDVVALDTSAQGKVTDVLAGTVDSTGTDWYKTRIATAAEDRISGITLVALEPIAAGASGMFAERGEVLMKLAASAHVLGSRVMVTTGAGVTSCTLAVAAAGNVKAVAIVKAATAGAAGVWRVDLEGRHGFGYLGA